MNHDDFNIEIGSDECKALLETSTPYVYRQNAFRITGLPADVSIRDIKRRIDDLKHAEEIGDAADEHSHAYALKPPPTLADIREAAQILQDPERRIIQEFYWFWPLEWGSGKNDPALVALNKGDITSAFNTWKQTSNGLPESAKLVYKHNLAILYQLVVLDHELANFQKNLSEESLKKVKDYWSASSLYCKEILQDDLFWKLVSNRIISVGDPRLTVDLSVRIRKTLPKALHKISGQLALIYVEHGKSDMAGKHAEYIAATYQGLADDISTTFKLITKPTQKRILDAVAIAKETAERQPDKAADAATDLFKAVAKPLVILEKFLSLKDHTLIDLRDAVADAGLSCQKAFARKQKDWKRCLSILDNAKAFAISEDIRERIAEQYSAIQGTIYLAPIYEKCEEVGNASKNSPKNALFEGNRLLTITRPLLAALAVADMPVTNKNRAKDEVAGTLMQCAIYYGNETRELKGSLDLLKAAQQLAVDTELRGYIKGNDQLYHLLQSCDDVGTSSKNAPEKALSEGNRLLSIARPLIAELDAANLHVNAKSRAKEELAGTVAQCAIAYGNKTEDWKNSMALLAAAQQFAVSDGLKEFIERNLTTVRQNIRNGAGAQSQAGPRNVGGQAYSSGYKLGRYLAKAYELFK